MKSTVLTVCLLVLAGAVCHAQLSFLPQVGFEQSRTSINYNELSTSGVSGNFRANLKADYRLKGGHGPYVSVGTSPAPMNFNFSSTGDLMQNYQSAKGNLQFRIETGYQYTSSPISLFKKKTVAAPTETTDIVQQPVAQKTSCGSSTYKSSCGDKKKTNKTSLANGGLNMRLQPSLGVAYIPSNNEGITETPNGFQYASVWKTAIVPSMGFEFANGKQRFLTLNVFYTQPVGVKDESFTAFSGSKAVTTNLSPATSTWGITAGVPFSFVKSNASKTKKAKKDCHRVIYRRCYKS